MSQLEKDYSFEKGPFVFSDKYKNRACQKKQQPLFHVLYPMECKYWETIGDNWRPKLGNSTQLS